MGDSVQFEESGHISLTNGDITPPNLEPEMTQSPSNLEPEMTQSIAVKSNLVHSNGNLKTHKSESKHHVKFSEEQIVTEVAISDEREITNSVEKSDSPPHFSVLTLDNEGHPVYDIEEGIVETVTETQFREISPSFEQEPSCSGFESNSPEVTQIGECEPIGTKTVVYKGPVIRLQRWPSAESHENPFQQDGELSKKADFIVRNSTISRTEVLIADPDKTKAAAAAAAAAAGEPVIEQDEIIAAQSAPVAHAAPDSIDGPTRPNDIKVKENGNVDDAATPQSVEVEVGKGEAEQPEAQTAEEVKIPKKRGKCCVVQ